MTGHSVGYFLLIFITRQGQNVFHFSIYKCFFYTNRNNPESGHETFTAGKKQPLQKSALSCRKSHTGLNLLLTQVKSAFAKTCQHGIPVT